MHGGQWPKVGATLALMWLKRFEKLFNLCVCSLSFKICTHNHCACLLYKPEIYDLFKSSFRAWWTVKRMIPTHSSSEWISTKPMKEPCKYTMAGWCNSSSKWVQSVFEFRVTDTYTYKVHRVNFGICICSFRQLFSLLRLGQISWRPSPRAGMSKKRSASKKSENSSPTSAPRLMLFMRYTVSWMLIE